MQAKLNLVKPTQAKLTVEGDASDIKEAKLAAIAKFSANLKAPGFRPGKVPVSVAEKYIDNTQLIQETLEIAVNDLYMKAVVSQHIRPVNRPEISVNEFEPYSALKFEADVEVVGEVKLASYSGLKVDRQTVKITAQDVNGVLKRLQTQTAQRKSVTRATSEGDEVIIDFDGSYTDSGDPIQGGSGKDYPLEIGSKTFIPGFEEQLIGLKPRTTKEFQITFPDNYSVASLRGKKATFKVKINKVNEIVLPKLDDQFAIKAGPFKNLDDLKSDIRKQLKESREDEVSAHFQNTLVAEIVDSSEVAIPESLLADEVGRFERDQRQNAAYQGMTWKEYLEAEGLNDVEFSTLAHQQAEQRVKSGLVLGEIANREKISVGKTELDERLNKLKAHYSDDKSMQVELSKPQNQEDIKNRILVEKTIHRLEELNP